MAHFAELDQNNKVIRVIVIHNNELLENGSENEQKGIDFCKSLYGAHTQWAQTSYNGSFRKNYAGAGDTFDTDRDAFITPKVFDSWVLNEATCRYQAPTPYPTDDKDYYWDEDTLTWKELS
jgi:hypothetical protein